MPNKIIKIFIPLSLIIPICLPFSSIAWNIPGGERKSTRNLIPVSKDYKIPPAREARLMLPADRRNTGIRRWEIGGKEHL